jgi:hypothetical protein
MLLTVPSPLAGEGSSVLPRVMMGEGVRVTRTPHPFEFVGAPLCPLPQGERAREASTDMSANEATRSGVGRSTNLRLWETIVGSVSLFPACYLQGMLQLQRVER